ncbi:MAG: glycoside hydrolase family 15 protein [Fibrobacter sp.]|jgi:GH15 family glucan-1,4-alpha-glucosidase|nr:glycoside hydrolase family 15 protein [Fibrobacter sp.]
MENLDYGVIGNCLSAALVSKEGTIEWLCLPYFDSPSVFASILDKQNGGHFSIIPMDLLSSRQQYIKNTNILVTSFQTQDGSFDIIDFMPRYRYDDGDYHCPPDIIRYVKLRGGKPRIRIIYVPSLNYGASKTENIVGNDFIKTVSASGNYESLYLYSNLSLKEISDSSAMCLENDSFFLLSYNEKLPRIDLEHINLEYQLTRAYWMNWAARSTFSVTAFGDEITRSLLVLKLLSFQPTGAILAAATTSLPETPGAERNWDYRYCWIRDASMTTSILARMGHIDSAKRYMQFILNIVPFKDEKIQIMYGIRGEKNLTERFLSHLAGYENSTPVRIGNAAFSQKQNDIYGVLLDIILIFLSTFKCDPQTKESLWTIVRSIARTVTESWNEPDMGIWEFRSQKQHFTFSKLLCWMAMDRASRIAAFLGKNSFSITWCKTREIIKEDIMEKGWNGKINSFTQYYGSEHLDAANLLMEPYGFLDASDPRYVMTVTKTLEQLCKNGLMYRYRNDDDFGKPESSFTLCSFWMISALFKIGEKERACAMFEKLLSHSNHLKLFSEDIDFTSGRLLGNFPQAYSHLALIDTAVLLYGSDKSIPEERGQAEKMEIVYS